MKLSEAIRVGSKNIKQIKGSLLSFESTTKEINGACALGCVYIASNFLEPININSKYEFLYREYPDLKDVFLNFGDSKFMLYNLIIHLNDTLLWDFNKIADYLEKIGY